MNNYSNLLYGSFVRISGKTENQQKGYLTSKGFYEQSIYFQTYDDMNNVNNFRESIFQILPRGSFDVHNEYIKNNLSDEEYMIKLKSEQDQYFTMIDTKLNEEVYFTSDVIFQHFESGMYLACTEECSETRPDSYHLKLQQCLSNNIVFKIEPSKPYQQTGRPIISKQTVTIQSELNKFFINRNLKNPVQLDNKAFVKHLNFELRSLSNGSHRYETIVSHNNECNWKIELCNIYEKQKINKNIICTHDIVAFKSTSTNTFLCADYTTNQIKFKTLNFDQEILVDSLWELDFQITNTAKQQSKNLQQKTINVIGQSNSCYHHQSNLSVGQKDLLNFQNKQKLKFKKKFSNQLQLRNILTGKIFDIDDVQDVDNLYQPLLTYDSQYLTLELANNYDTEINDSTYVKIVKDECTLTLKRNFNSSFASNSKVNYFKTEQFLGSSTFYKQFQTNSDLEILCGFQPKVEGETFQIIKIRSIILKEILQPFSGQEFILHFIYFIKHNFYNLDVLYVYQQIDQTQFLLKGLCEFLIDNKFTEENYHILPIKSRQMILKELCFGEIIVELIYSICYKYKTQLIDLQNKHYKCLEILVELGFLFFIKFVEGNLLTKQYMSQWFDMFFQLFLDLTQIYIEQFLHELLNNNQESIKEFITLDTIQIIINAFKLKDQAEKCLRLLCCICLTNDQPIRINQLFVLNHFFKQLTPEYKITLQRTNEKLIIQSQKLDNNWYSLYDFFLKINDNNINDSNIMKQSIKSHLSGDQNQYKSCFQNYFICYFELLNAISYKNSQAIDYIKSNFQFSYFIELLQTAKQLNYYNLMRPFLKIIKNVFLEIQCTDILNISVISLRDLNNKYKNQIPNQSHFDNLKLFLFNELNFNQNTIQNVDQIKNLPFVLEIIKLLIKNRLWQQREQIKQILFSMYYMLGYIDQQIAKNFNYFTSLSILECQQFKSQNDQKLNNCSLMCQQLAYEIIFTIFDLENNIRSFKFLQQIKDPLIDFDNETFFEKINSSNVKQTNLQGIQSINKNVRQFAVNLLQKYENSKKSINESQWIKLFINIIQSRIFFKDQNLVLNFNCSFHNEDKLVAQYQLKLLQRLYGQRNELISQLNKIVIVVNGKTKEFQDLCQIVIKKLNVIDNLEEFFSIEQTVQLNNLNSVIWHSSNDQQKSGLIQSFYQLSQFLKKDYYKGRCQDPLSISKYVGENSSFLIYCEREQNNKLNQSIIMQLQIQNYLIKYVEGFKIDLPIIYWKLLHSIYELLIVIIWNNQENKQILQKQVKFIKKVQEHIEYNVGAIDFLKVLFQNNKRLLFSDKEINFILQLILFKCNKCSNKQFHKSKLLEFLHSLLLINSKCITQNQTLIFQKLQEKQFNNLLLNFNFLIQASSPSSPNNIESISSITSQSESDKNTEELIINDLIFKEWINDYEKKYEKLDVGFHEINLFPQLSYMQIFFSLLTLLVEENHLININKCRKLYKDKDLLLLLYYATNCWPIKRHLRSYINRINILNFNLFIQIDIYTILDDLQKIIDYRTLQKYSFMTIAQIKYPIKHKYLFSYIHMYLEEIIISLNKIFLDKNNIQHLEIELEQNFTQQNYLFHFQIFEIVQKLILIQNIYPNHYIAKQCNLLLDVLYGIIKCFDTSILLIREQLMLKLKEINLAKQKIKLINNNQYITEYDNIQQILKCRCMYHILTKYINKNEIKSYLLHQIFDFEEQQLQEKQMQTLVNFWKKSVNISKNQKIDINEQINYRLKQTLNTVQQTQQVMLFFEEEFYQACQKITNSNFNNQLENTLNSEFINNAINYFVNENTDDIPDDIRIFFFQLLRRTITEQNKGNSEKRLQVDVWNSNYWINYKDQIIETQNLLAQRGACKLILALFSENLKEMNLLLINECLLFSIALLLGGNSAIQSIFLLKLKFDQQNVILTNIKNLITRLTKAVSNSQSFETNNDNQQELILTVDSFNFFNIDTMIMQRIDSSQQTSKEQDYQTLCIDLLCRVFRVMQLMCENNQSSMKEFFRIQTDDQNVQKINSINFIEFTCSQLRIYLKSISKTNMIVLASILDFINEIIQLPCIENQITLCRTTFFEDVSNMTIQIHHKKNQTFTKEKNDIQELYNKILLTVQLVQESNEEKIFKDIENKLEVNCLINFLKLNLDLLSIFTLQDLKNYLNCQKRSFSDEILRILNVCIIEQKMNQKSKWIQRFQEQLDKNNLTSIYLHLIDLIHNVEIIYNGIYMTIYFPFHPLFHLLSEQSKQEFLFNVKRETQREKLLGLLNSTNIFFYELEHNFQLMHFKIPLYQGNIRTLRTFSSILVIFINLIMIITYTVTVEKNMYTITTNRYCVLLMKLLSVSQFAIQLILFVLVSFSRIPIFIKKQNIEQNKFKYIQSVFQDETCLLLLILVILSILGTLQSSTIFVVHLFELFSRISILKNVFQAISYNAKQLIVVSCLGVLFVFAFSVISFSVYFDDIYENSDLPEKCNSLISCMITLITSGVIGNSMIIWDPVKFFFDMIFTVFFGLLFTNIVQGIMIDTFAELRDQRQKIEEDINNRCFICQAQRQDLETKNKSFEDHILKKHFIWDYVFYIKCLQLKEYTEYTGLEYWILDKINEDDVSWFPEVVIDETNVTERLDKIENLITSIQIQLDNIQKE